MRPEHGTREPGAWLSSELSENLSSRKVIKEGKTPGAVIYREETL